jgi:hypothetical protein
MSLNNNRKSIFVNLVEGKFVIKNLQTGEKEYYDNLTGRITSIQFKDDVIKGQVSKIVLFEITDNIDSYLLQMRLVSGYFRTLCNSLKSGNPKKIITLSGAVKPLPNGKSKTVIFVKQDGRVLKHCHTKDNMGDCPDTEYLVYKGKPDYDNSKQIEYFVNWLKSINFSQEENPLLTDSEKKEILEQDADEMGDNDIAF